MTTLLLSSRRRWFALLSVFQLVFSLLLFYGILSLFREDSSTSIRESLISQSTSPSPVIDLWRTLSVLYASHRPIPSSLPDAIRPPEQGIGGINNSQIPLEQLKDNLKMEDADIDRMRTIHRDLVDSLPLYPRIAKGKGLVMLGGGRYMRIALASLRMLRRTGTTLPVELWVMDHTEWDPLLCDPQTGILASMKVKCRELGRILRYGNNTDDTILDFKTYQLKVLTILFSQFEQILFLDSDAFPTMSLDNIFDVEPFSTRRVVAWPDYWYATVSPYFYSIANLNGTAGHSSPSRSERLATRGTVDSGILMWDKRTHWRALLLATYYNVWGPDYFFRLHSLNGPGMGDKETFLLACRVLENEFYLVAKPPGVWGYFETTSSGTNFRGTAMTQADPREDVLDEADMSEETMKGQSQRPIQPLFIHANERKLDAERVILHNAAWNLNSETGEKQHFRMWGDKQRGPGGLDFEKMAFDEVMWIECESQIRATTGEVCGIIREHYQIVFGKPEERSKVNGVVE